MKRGFTLVELIVSFSLVAVIVIFLTQIVLNVNKMYQNSGIKTEIMNKQSLISSYINKRLNEKVISSLNDCGTNCIEFNYIDETADRFQIDYINNTLSFGSFKSNLPKNTVFKDVKFETIYGATIDSDVNNAILKITIPIYNKSVKNTNFDVIILYPFNSNDNDFSNVQF